MLKPRFKLEVFEGPLDLLLHLIQKNRVNIYDIPVAEITRQYIEYMHAMEELSLEVTSDFIAMAAHLLYIKSRLLLPGHEEEPEEDPRDELAERLAEYKKIKEAASILRETQFGYGNNYFKEPENIGRAAPVNIRLPLSALLDAFAAVLERSAAKEPPPRSLFKGIVECEKVSVGEKIRYILNLVRARKRTSFESVFAGMTTRAELIATFLAVLHLIGRGRITVTDKNNRLFLA